MHALVIDDEPQVRGFISLVRGENREVSEVGSAERAFEMLRDREWGLVVCDVMPGGEDGLSVLRRFKEESPASQVVLITGNGSAGGVMGATALGAFNYLLKPFTAGEFKALSQTVKERSRLRPHGSSMPCPYPPRAPRPPTSASSGAAAPS